MPELPDVEATRLYLEPVLSGRTFTGAHLGWPSAVQRPAAGQLGGALRGQKVQGLDRRAKYLLLNLASGQTLVLHLGMTGALVVIGASESRHRFAHNVFELDGGAALQFIDPRKLGRVWLVKETGSLFQSLGPEPVGSLTPTDLASRLLQTGAVIKAALCDQEVIAGLGNIYADEVLFAAALHPLKRAKELTAREIEAVHRAMAEVLPRATACLAKLMPLPEPPSESKGGTQVLQVPRAAGAPCPRCASPVQRAEVRGRGTYFCSRCQK